MKLLEFVTPTTIYHGCSTRNTIWEENFIASNMKSCGHRNVRKHKEIKNGDQYIALKISLNIVRLDKREVTSSGSIN